MARGWITLKEIPAWNWGGGVYALYDHGSLIYVGHTGNLRYRLFTHRRRFAFDTIKVAPIDGRRERQFLERRLLYRIRPFENRTVPSDLYATWWYRGRLIARRQAEA